MACLYCGKRVSTVRQMADPDFCSDEHRRRYGDMARAALSRLMELDATESTESPGRRPAVPGPALVERPASSGPKPRAARHEAPAEPRAPRLAAVTVIPAERGILDVQLAACDVPASRLCFPEYEFAPPLVCFGESGATAVSFTPPALREELQALPQRLRAHGLLRSCGAIGMPEREITLPARRGSSDRTFAGPASSYDFQRVEGRARRRFARPRTTAAPRFAVASICYPIRAWRAVAPQGMATAASAPQPARGLTPAAEPVLAEAAMPARAVRLPQTCATPASGLPRGDIFAAIGARCDLGFRTVAPGARKGIVSASQAGGGLQAREAVAPGRSLPGRASGSVSLQTLLPLHAATPAPGLRAISPGVDHLQPSAQPRIPALPPAGPSCNLCWLPLFPVAAPAVRNRMARAATGVDGAFTAASAGSAWQPMQQLVRKADPSGPLRGFGLLPSAPRPVIRPATARECSPCEAPRPAVHIPNTGRPAPREAVLAGAGWAASWRPKPRAVASDSRMQPVQLTHDPIMPAALPSSRRRQAVRQIRAGYFNPEPPGPRGGERKPRPAALDFDSEAEPPARKGAERLGIGANIASASAAPSAAPHACDIAPAPRSDNTPFAPHAPSCSLRSAAALRHEISAAGAAPPRIAPACRAVMPAPGSLEAASRPVLLPRAGQFGPGAPSGIRAVPLGHTSSNPIQAAASFRREPAFAPELPVADPGMPAPAPVWLLPRVLKVSGFEPPGAAATLKIASQAHLEHDAEFRTAVALPKREIRIRAVLRIGACAEVRLALRAPVIAGLPRLAEVGFPIPRILLAAALGGGPLPDPSAAPAPRQADRAEARMMPAAAAVLQSGEDLLQTMDIAAPGPLDGPAAPRMAGLKAATGVRPARRGNAARPAVTMGAPAGTVVLPSRRIRLSQPGCPAAGFAGLEVMEHGEIRHAVTRPSEAPVAEPVLPRYPGPDAVLIRGLRVPGALNAYPQPHAGMCLPAETGPLITEIAPVIIPCEATPEVDDRREALAPAVPDDFALRRARKIGSRLFR